MIQNIRRSNMGTVCFDGKFDGMRKSQDFIVYPMKEAETRAMIQSDTRIGWINLDTGKVMLSPPRSGGSYFVHLRLAKGAGALDAEQLLMLKAQIMGSASGMAGTNGVVYTDNSGALQVFGKDATP